MKLNTSLPPAIIKKPEDPAIATSRKTSDALVAVRAEIATVASKVDELGTRITEQQERHTADLKARLAQAMQKRPITFDVKRGLDGLIESVVARPA